MFRIDQEEMANRVAKAMVPAVESCGGAQPEPNPPKPGLF
jgi:hypothetical protein